MAKNLSTNAPGMSRAEIYWQRWQAMESTLSSWSGLWDICAKYAMPRKVADLYYNSLPELASSLDIYDDEAIIANSTLASGQLDYLISGEWFQLESPRGQLASADERKWYKEAGEQIIEDLLRTNHMLESHEFFLNRGGMGTAAYIIEQDDDTNVRFLNLPVGSFAILENEKGYVDTVYRKLQLTARQAEQEFGRENLPKDISDVLDDATGKDMTRNFDFIHIIEPRPAKERAANSDKPEDMPFASIYIAATSKKIVREGGYHEMPAICSRYLKWGSNGVYGYCPTIECLPTIRQLNYMELMLDSGTELAVNPRVLVPDDLVGQVDLRAAGVTVFNRNTQQLPREWGTQGRLDFGDVRAQGKRERIKRAFHTDLFQMLTSLENMRVEKTAYEVQQMLAEKTTRISPTFSRIIVEALNPTINRVFRIYVRNGYFKNPPPASILEETVYGPAIPEPTINYVSKLAMAVKASRNATLQSTMGVIFQLGQVDEACLDPFNIPNVALEIARNNGIPSAAYATDGEIKQKRQARANAQRDAAQAQAAETASSVAKNISAVKPETLSAFGM